MKLQSNNLLNKLTTVQLENLTAEVRETLDSNYKKDRKKMFSAAQLWDLRRRRKNLLAQRNYF